MIREAIAKATQRENLSRGEARGVMEEVMDGSATPSQIASFLTALLMKGETVDEIVGCASVMRERVTRINTARTPVVDTCGTGGDGVRTFNVSTAAAFVIAASGVCVAKHGNRAVSSRCGSADVIEALGIKLDLPVKKLEESLDKTGIAFLFAPALHASMKHASIPRRETGIKSIFNLVGPLTNPAGAKRQVIGVYRADLTEKLALALKELGSTRAFVVHGLDGLDEISVSAPTKVTELREGDIHTYEIRPGDFGIHEAPLSEIEGGTSEENAGIIVSVLSGARGPKREIVLLNAAAGLAVSGKVEDMKAGLKEAARLVDSGAAPRKTGRNAKDGKLRLSLLSEILRQKREEVARRKKEGLSGPRSPSSGTHLLSTALIRQELHNPLNLICEVKKASPSSGAFDLSMTPGALARGYEVSGAAAISVVTDRPYFGGDLELLSAVRKSVSCPILLKDFVIDKFQVEEASFLGAAGVLLIARILEDNELRELAAAAFSMGLDVIAEVHNEEELRRVLGLDGVMIGINNRDLDTLKIDIETTFRLAGMVEDERIIVSESGISTRREIERLEEAGIDAALVGTSLLKSRDPFGKIRELKGGSVAG